VLPGEPEQAAALGLDLLALIEDEGDVAVRVLQQAELQLDGHAALHVGGAAAVEQVALDPARQVAGHGHGVDVPGDHHPLGAAEGCPGHDVLADALHGQVRQRGERLLDGVGDRFLTTAHRLDVHELCRQRAHVLGKVKPHAS
jgi:hypothetical protein